jgi:hypothetical protein
MRKLKISRIDQIRRIGLILYLGSLHLSVDAQRFRDTKAGRFVSPSYVRVAVDDDISETKDQMQELAESL